MMLLPAVLAFANAALTAPLDPTLKKPAWTNVGVAGVKPIGDGVGVGVVVFVGIRVGVRVGVAVLVAVEGLVVARRATTWMTQAFPSWVAAALYWPAAETFLSAVMFPRPVDRTV